MTDSKQYYSLTRALYESPIGTIFPRKMYEAAFTHYQTIEKEEFLPPQLRAIINQAMNHTCWFASFLISQYLNPRPYCGESLIQLPQTRHFIQFGPRYIVSVPAPKITEVREEGAMFHCYSFTCSSDGFRVPISWLEAPSSESDQEEEEEEEQEMKRKGIHFEYLTQSGPDLPPCTEVDDVFSATLFANWSRESRGSDEWGMFSEETLEHRTICAVEERKDSFQLVGVAYQERKQIYPNVIMKCANHLWKPLTSDISDTLALLRKKCGKNWQGFINVYVSDAIIAYIYEILQTGPAVLGDWVRPHGNPYWEELNEDERLAAWEIIQGFQLF